MKYKKKEKKGLCYGGILGYEGEVRGNGGVKFSGFLPFSGSFLHGVCEISAAIGGELPVRG